VARWSYPIERAPQLRRAGGEQVHPDFAQFVSIFMVEAVGVSDYFYGFLNYVGMAVVDVP
jgi:hypothetical protein